MFGVPQTFRVFQCSASNRVSSHNTHCFSFFHLQYIYYLIDQRFELPQGLDAKSIRIVCTMNQISRFLGQHAEVLAQQQDNNANMNANQFEAVGFYSIKFE